MFKCPNCGKSYKREGMLNRHKTICTFLSQPQSMIDNDLEESDTLPSQLEMYRAMCALTQKCLVLEEKVKKLEATVKPVKKDKMSCIDWLNANLNIVVPFKQFLQCIEITDGKSMLNHLNKDSLGDIFDLYLVPEFKIIDEIPIRSSNSIMYTLDNDLKWGTLSHSEFCECIKVFEKKLLYILNQNKDELIKNDTYTDIMMKLVVVDNGVYSQLRKKICGMVSFEYN